MSARSPLREKTQPRRGLSREEAAVYVGVSVSYFDMLVSAGKLPRPARVGGRRIWDMKRLDLAADALFDADGRNEWDAA